MKNLLRALCAIILLACSNANASELIPVRFLFDLGPMGNHSWILRGIEDGTFKKHGFKVEVLGEGTGSVRTGLALSANKADIGYQDFSGVVLVNGKQKVPGFKAIFVVDDKSQDGFFFLPESNVKTWADLKGKTIGGFPTSVTSKLVKLITDVEINYENLPYSLRATALASKKVDGIEGFLTTNKFNLKKVGVNEFTTLMINDNLTYTVSRVITASNGWLTTYPGADVLFRQALLEALNNHIKDPALSIKSMRGPLVITPELRELELERAQYNIDKLIVTEFTTSWGINNAEKLAPRLNQYIDVMNEKIDIEYKHPYTEYYKLD